MTEKLKEKSAETLVETLVGIMIVALASSMFLSMVTISSKVNKKSDDSDKLFYHTMSLLECYETDTEAAIKKTKGSVTVSVSDSPQGGENRELESFEVEVFYGNDMSSYRKYRSGGGS